MKKNILKILPLFLCLFLAFSISSCSKDDEADIDNGGDTKSSLTVDGKSVEITDLEAEYEGGVFAFWVNDALSTDKRVYIQAEFSAKESISAETDIKSKFSILFQRNKGSEWFMQDGYQSGKIIVKNVDSSKKVLTIEFKEAKYLSNLKKSVVINGTLTVTYKVI